LILAENQPGSPKAPRFSTDRRNRPSATFFNRRSYSHQQSRWITADLAGSHGRIHGDGATFTITTDKEDHPMLEVSWYGAVTFLNWRSAMEGRPLL